MARLSSLTLLSSLSWLVQHYPDELNAMMSTKQVVIGKTDNLPSDGSLESVDEQTVKWIKEFIGEDEDPTEPICVFYYPIVSGSNEEVKNHIEDKSVLGTLVLTFFWREFVKDILVSF